MYRIWMLVLLIPLGLLGACDRQTPAGPDSDQQSAPDSPAAATVNGMPISHAMLEAYLQARGLTQPTPAQRKSGLDDLISLVLLKQQAEKTGLTDDPQLQAALHLERVNSIASAMAREYTSAHPVTDAEAQARYQSGVQQAGRTEYLLRHILVSSKEKAQQVVAQLNEGADFAQLAEEVSTDQGVDAGGSLGWLNLAQLPPPLTDVVKTTPPGNYSKTPVQTLYGWHIVKVEDTREFTPPSLDQVRTGIISTMQRERIDQYVSSLRADARIDIKADFAAPVTSQDDPQ